MKRKGSDIARRYVVLISCADGSETALCTMMAGPLASGTIRALLLSRLEAFQIVHYLTCCGALARMEKAK